VKTYDVLTIGGGPAGITIAKILGNEMKVGIVRPEDHSMVYCAMPYVIENIIPKEKTFKKDELVTGSGAELIRGNVTQVSFDDKTVTLNDGTSCKYDKLIIATGADPILPPISGTDLKGVHTFKTGDDLDLLESAAKDPKTKKAVIVGAGAIGVELCQALNKVTQECHLVDIAASVLPNLIDADFSKDVQEELEALGVVLHLNCKVIGIQGNNSVEGVLLDNGETIPLGEAGIVVFAVGMRANTDLFKDTSLRVEKQGIVVNSRMETNIRDVYAVGDCTQFTSGITGKVVLGKLATNAVPMARMLAKNLLGDDRIYRGFYNGAATKVGRYFIGGTGFTEAVLADEFDIVTGRSELATIFPIMPDSKRIKMKLIADGSSLRVLGGQVIGEAPVTDKVDIITLAIQHNLTAGDLAELSYSAQPYQSFFPANNLIVACAEDILRDASRFPKRISSISR
jgi:NADH oxidase (H2O2-forming)